MCGICGYISGKTYNGEQMISSLHHRGPDNTGLFNETVNNTHLFLGHARLSIIDTSSCGNQPMISASGNTVLIYNGETYNHEELRKKYLQEISFKSTSDTEVILYLYEKLGIDFVSQLRGDFALAIYDKVRQKVLLVRDRMGVKPFYYYINNNELIFGSEIKALKVAKPGLQLNKENLKKYFVFKYSPLDETLFTDVKRLMPGHILEYDLQTHQHKIINYWSFKKDEAVAKLSFNDASERLKELLNHAVTSQLMSDVPVGTFFSGGIDSSIIASYVRGKDEIIHYTARKSVADLKEEGSSSDFAFAEKLGKEWGMHLEAIDIGSGAATNELLKKTLFYSDDLIADGSQIPSYLITQAAGARSRVMLSGMGADELFLGYAGHQISLLSTYLDSFPSFLNNGINNFFASLHPGKGSFKPYKRYLHKLGRYHSYGNLRYGFFNIVGDYANSTSVFKGDEDSVLNVFQKYFGKDNDVFSSISDFERDNFLVKNLHYLDRMAMANSVEGRVPFLDKDLVDFAYSLPLHHKLSKTGETKSVLKHAYKNILPGYVINRRKAGFGMPLRSIYKKKDQSQNQVDVDFLKNFNDFNIPAIEQLIVNHQNGVEDNSAIIYSIVCFQEWYKINF